MTIAPQFSTGLNNSYRCLKEQSLNLIFEGGNKTVGELKISKLQFQAFRNDNTTNFGLGRYYKFLLISIFCYIHSRIDIAYYFVRLYIYIFFFSQGLFV